MRRLGREDLADPIALAVAALWLLHPIQTEAVNYLIQRTELLVSLCYVGTLYAWIRAHDATTLRATIAWRVGAAAVCLIGMGSKEVMITAPLLIILYDRAFVTASWRNLANDRGRVLGYCALWSTGTLTVAMVLGNARGNTVGFGLGVPWYRYLYSQCWAIAHYLRLVLWPNVLAFDYGDRPITGFRGIPGAMLLGLIGIATLVAWVRSGRWLWPGFLGAAFLLLLAPSSSVIPITTEIAAERRIYLALVPVLVLVVLGIHHALSRRSASNRRATRTFAVVIGVLLAVMTVATYARSRTYANAETLWSDAVRKVPDNPRAYDNLAALMFYDTPPRAAEAGALWQKAVDLDSTYVNAWRGLALVAESNGRVADAETFLRRAIAIKPGYADAVDQLGRLLGREGHPDLALPYLLQYAAAYPSDSALTVLGVALVQTSHVEDALTAFRSALALNPGSIAARQYLSGLLVDLGRGAEAVALLETSRLGTAIDAGVLSLAYAEAGRVDDARKAAQVASENARGDAAPLILAGRSMIVAHRQSDAVQYLSEALRLSPGNPEAAAYLARAKATPMRER
jgi:tetratricopeptide (TPR) repeat protein